MTSPPVLPAGRASKASLGRGRERAKAHPGREKKSARSYTNLAQKLAHGLTPLFQLRTALILFDFKQLAP